MLHSNPCSHSPCSWLMIEGAGSVHRGSSPRRASPIVISSLKEAGLCPTHTPSHTAYCVCKVGQAGSCSISSLRTRFSLTSCSCPQLLYSIELNLNALVWNAQVQVQDLLLPDDGTFRKSSSSPSPSFFFLVLNGGDAHSQGGYVMCVVGNDWNRVSVGSMLAILTLSLPWAQNRDGVCEVPSQMYSRNKPCG